MTSNIRIPFFCVAFLAIVAAFGWATLSSSLPPADFTFCNESEIKSLDPAIVSGSPEGRIIGSLYEGLARWHPETLKPVPGVAKRWEISKDGLTYTFYLREDASWSDGSSVTAEDFHYSLQRFLSPWVLAEYAYQGWYIKNAQRYSKAGSGIEPGDAVEVELNLPKDSINTLRGEVLVGKLVAIENAAEEDGRTFVVLIDGKEFRFRATDDEQAETETPPTGLRWCRYVLLDFREVGVKVVDRLTLEITLEHPTPYFLSVVGFYPLCPVQRACLEKHGSPGWMKAGNLVCNGPFQLQFRRIRDRIRMVRSETYWGREEVQLGVVDALSVDQVTTALNLYMTDASDWITDVPPPAMRILRAAQPPRNDLNPGPWLASYFYLINTTRKPLDDVRVRHALSLALDREEITSKILAAGELPSYSLVPPGLADYRRQESSHEDAERARKLLAEAGFPEGKGFPRIDILYNTHESHQAIAELIRTQWQQVLGISVKTRNEEWASYLSSQRQKKYNVCRRGWIADYADPNTFLDMFVTDGEQNNTGWSNAEYDRLIEDAGREPDAAKRLTLLEKAERILMDELPILPIYSYKSKCMVKPYVRGFYNNALDYHPIRDLWIDHNLQGPNEFMGGQRR